MLIVCPSCATSYMIDPAALDPGGRTVRCARCKVTWFAGERQPDHGLDKFVGGVIAEAATHDATENPTELTQSADNGPPAGSLAAAEEDDFGSELPVPAGEADGQDDESEGELHPPPEPDLTEPSTVVEAPPLAPPAEDEFIHDGPDEQAGSDEIESFAARRQRLQARRKQKRRSSHWVAIALVLFAINVAVIGTRDEVVRHLPQTASFFSAIGLPVNLRHLSFENVRISKDQQDGVNVLIVQGSIVSTASKPITVPRLRFAALDAAGQEIYTWTALPTRSIVGPGDRIEFRTRLASPPADARNVMVRFFNAQDAAPGGD
jgi:predicted Zn finger-like uncharacterized protein